MIKMFWLYFWGHCVHALQQQFRVEEQQQRADGQNENQMSEADGREVLPWNGSSSVVWWCFRFRAIDVKQEQLKCRQCSRLVSKPLSNTTILLNHLNYHHKLQFEKYMKAQERKHHLGLKCHSLNYYCRPESDQTSITVRQLIWKKKKVLIQSFYIFPLGDTLCIGTSLIVTYSLCIIKNVTQGKKKVKAVLCLLICESAIKTFCLIVVLRVAVVLSIFHIFQSVIRLWLISIQVFDLWEEIYTNSTGLWMTTLSSNPGPSSCNMTLLTAEQPDKSIFESQQPTMIFWIFGFCQCFHICITVLWP